MAGALFVLKYKLNESQDFVYLVYYWISDI